MCVFSSSVKSDSWGLYGLQPALLCPWGFPGKNTGVGCHFLLQGIFQTHKSNSHLMSLLHYRWILYLWVVIASCFKSYFSELRILPIRIVWTLPNMFVHACICSVAQSWPTLCNSIDLTPKAHQSKHSPGKNTGVGFHALIQGIFLAQGSIPCLLHLLHW